LSVEIEAALAGASAVEWATRLNAAGVPAGEILSIPEILAHPQTLRRNLVHRFEQAPGLPQNVSVVRAGFRLKSGDLALVLRPGVKASTPVVAIVVNRIGELLTLPKMVDCAQPEHAVENSIPGSLIKARINIDHMVRRLMYSRTQAFMSR
jgi:hypothetical protein